jgi:hypothetical protein
MQTNQIEAVLRDVNYMARVNDLVVNAPAKPSPNVPQTFAEGVSRLESSPATSYWLMDAVRDLDKRDPVDALNDAETLVFLFKLKLGEPTT